MYNTPVPDKMVPKKVRDVEVEVPKADHHSRRANKDEGTYGYVE